MICLLALCLTHSRSPFLTFEKSNIFAHRRRGAALRIGLLQDGGNVGPFAIARPVYGGDRVLLGQAAAPLLIRERYDGVLLHELVPLERGRRGTFVHYNKQEQQGMSRISGAWLAALARAKGQPAAPVPATDRTGGGGGGGGGGDGGGRAASTSCCRTRLQTCVTYTSVLTTGVEGWMLDRQLRYRTERAVGPIDRRRTVHCGDMR